LNCSMTVEDDPAGTVNVVDEITENAPLPVTLVTFKAALPVFFTVRFAGLLPFSATLLKLTPLDVAMVGVPPVPPPGMVSVPEPVMLKVPLPDPLAPVPVPDAVTLKVPVAPAKPSVPLEKEMVAGPLVFGVPARTCASSVSEPVSSPVSVPVGLPLVIVMVIGAEPDSRAVARVKFELNVPVPMLVRVAVPVAEMLPPELVPLPVIVSVLLMAPPDATPFPENGTSGAVLALLLIVRLPLAVPATVGANCTVTVCVAPGCSVNGNALGGGAVTVTAALGLTIELTISGAVPLLEMVNVCVDV